MTTKPVRISIIVPTHNNARDLHECLSALQADAGPNSEIIVVDDASTDEIREVGVGLGIPVLRLAKNSGPSSARNLGARHAPGDILFFVDSDVVVRAGTVQRLLQRLDSDATIAAIFGSYDNQPRAHGVVSQYRNLLHHYMHQTGNPEASTFWGGCGAIRRSVFEAVGGFDERRFGRCMEDVELGYRLRKAGYRIVLDKTVQGTHLKKWTLRSMIRADVWCRAIPWTRLILDQQNAPNDLNLRTAQRVSTALVALAAISFLLSALRVDALAVSAALLVGVIVLNKDLYGFYIRERGLAFTLAAIPLHFLYFAYGGLAYLCVWCDHRLKTSAPLQPVFKRTRL